MSSLALARSPRLRSAEPTAFWLNPGGWVALAVLIVFALLIWKKVPGAVGRALDCKIALIRDQLAEAESLRKEAEALKAEYEAKSASADKDREALLERARHEADEIVAKAKSDSEALIERRTRMAEERSPPKNARRSNSSARPRPMPPPRRPRRSSPSGMMPRPTPSSSIRRSRKSPIKSPIFFFFFFFFFFKNASQSSAFYCRCSPPADAFSAWRCPRPLRG